MNNLTSTTSTIADGNMSFRFGTENDVLRNRKAFLEKHGVAWDDHTCMRCNHGSKITTVNRSNETATYRMIDAEVLVTQEKRHTLMLLTADCLPTTLYDPVTKTLALAHFSRQKIAEMLPQKTSGFLREHFGVNPADIIVTTGPHIHTDSYCFPAPLTHISKAIVPFVTEVDGYAHINLPAAHNAQLIASGVLKKNITLSPVDTAVSPTHFSHYATTHRKKTEGRLATIVTLPS